MDTAGWPRGSAGPRAHPAPIKRRATAREHESLCVMTVAVSPRRRLQLFIFAGVSLIFAPTRETTRPKKPAGGHMSDVPGTWIQAGVGHDEHLPHSGRAGVGRVAPLRSTFTEPTSPRPGLGLGERVRLKSSESNYSSSRHVRPSQRIQEHPSADRRLKPRASI